MFVDSVEDENINGSDMRHTQMQENVVSVAGFGYGRARTVIDDLGV